MKSILFYLRVTNQLSPHPPPIINVFYFQSQLHYYFDISFEKHAISQMFVSKSCVSVCDWDSNFGLKKLMMGVWGQLPLGILLSKIDSYRAQN